MTDSSSCSTLSPPRVLPLGDAAWTVVFGTDVTAHNSALALGFCLSLSERAGQDPFKGVLEWAPAYATVTVYVDPDRTDQDAFADALRELARQTPALGMQGRQWLIPVCFEPDYAPDLHSLAQACGLSPKDVVQRMTQSVFTVRMLGFLPGFPYMDGLPAELSQPRLTVPRQAVPARSIAVAGRMCAAYPWVSPGGWHLLGRTPVPLFDLGRGEDPAMLAPGDRVQWRAVPVDAYLDMERDFARPGWDPMTLLQGGDGKTEAASLRFRPASEAAPPETAAQPELGPDGLIEVVDPAWAVTVQDGGRPGWRYMGVPMSGAADTRGLAAANMLVNNDPHAAGLELPGAGPTLRVADGPIRCALAGEGYLLRTDNRGRAERLPAWRGVTCQTGDTLQARLTDNKPAYLAFAGGLRLPPVLGSRATYARAHLGGLEGRSLRAGDTLPCRKIGQGDAQHDTQADALADTHGNRAGSDEHNVVTLRAIPGPQPDHFTNEAVDAFFSACYQVSADADRMGLRLQGPTLTHSEKGADIVTDGITPGAVQVPASGQPIILMQDAQTTGGYAKIAVVILADLPRLGRLRPGDRIRFKQVSLQEAARARQAAQHAMQAWQAGIRKTAPAGRIDEDALRTRDLISGVHPGPIDPADEPHTLTSS